MFTMFFELKINRINNKANIFKCIFLQKPNSMPKFKSCNIVLICISTFLLISCENETTPIFSSVSVTNIFEDSLKIHAISPIDENRVWFAGNKGKVGLIDHDIPKLASIKYEDKYLHFRSIAVTDESIFVLSIASPAVLYKIGFDGNEATNIETIYVESGERVFYNSMKFWNDLEGIAFGDPIDNCMTVILTRDGGNSWHKVDCETLPEAEKGEVAFAASNSNIAILGNHAWIATGGTKSRVMHTSDKGKTWEIYDTPVVSGEAMTGIHAIAFWNEMTGIVVGGNSKLRDSRDDTVAVTHDGGKTWELATEGKRPGYRSAVKYVPGGDGKSVVALGPTGISFSGDGGKNWKKISDEKDFFTLEFVNDTLAYASGINRISRLVFQK